jgi:hypothetical protein
MCATSQLMHAELKPVLYETVIWNQYFRDRLHASIDQPVVPEFQYIRYVFSRSFFNSDMNCLLRFIVLYATDYRCVNAFRKRAFPNLRAIIEQEWSPPRNPDRIFPPDYSVGLHIMRDTTLATLSSILAHQFLWRYAARDTRRRCTRSISCVDIAAGATLSVGDVGVHRLFKPSQDSSLAIHIQDGAQRQRVEISNQAIREMILAPQSAETLLKVDFVVGNFNPGIWVDQVSRLAADTARN